MRPPPLLLATVLAAAGCAKNEPAAVDLESSDPVIQELIVRYKPALGLKGDPDRGRELFAKACLHCHRMGGQGHELGPEAATFRARPPAQLLLDILDPSREVKPGYYAVRILTTDGQLIDGMLVNETSTEVILRRAAGESDTVPRTSIQRMKTTEFSVMPEGLEEAFDVQQMADLIAFMRSGLK